MRIIIEARKSWLSSLVTSGGTFNMSDVSSEKFQAVVEEYLIRHKSILDVMTKLQESVARVNRAVVKSVTSCGCTEISAQRQKFPENVFFTDIKRYMDSHLCGSMCQDCKEALESEIGRSIFYLTALCSTLDLDMEDIVSQENKRLRALGIFNLT